ncbi:MAG: hypothetical protein Q7S84_00580 [bacterium]|nr:hypothetical protein [bacterium]
MEQNLSLALAIFFALLVLTCVYILGRRAATFRGTEMSGIIAVIFILVCAAMFGIALTELQRTDSGMPLLWLFVAYIVLFFSFGAGYLRSFSLERKRKKA